MTETKQRYVIGAENPLYKAGKSHDANGYVVLSSKEHGADFGRREHRVVMERVLGRALEDSEVVHHINGDKGDNRPENLSVETRASHNRAHGTGRMLSCARCQRERWYGLADIARMQTKTPYCCRPCRYGRYWSNGAAA